MQIVRKSISFPKELADKISERAKLGNRSFSAQVVYDMTQITEILIANVKARGIPPAEFRETRIEDEE